MHFATATACALALLGGCGGGRTVEAEVEAKHATFPSAAQPRGTRAWPRGRFTGECRHSVFRSERYACLYVDDVGRRGFVCFDASADLAVRTASGPYDRRVWFDHHGREHAPEAVC